MSESIQDDETELKRLYWHSRRGMWELDLLLIPFLKHRYSTLPADDRQAYRALIEEEDQDLFLWLMRRQLPDEPDRRRIVQSIIEYAETTNNDQYRTL